MFDENGALKPPEQWPESVARAVASVETEEVYDWTDGKKVFRGYAKKIRFNSKSDALERLMRHLGLFERDNSQVKVEVNLVMAPREDNAQTSSSRSPMDAIRIDFQADAATKI